MSINNSEYNPFQTYFLSRELTKCPLYFDIIKFLKKINQLDLEQKNNVIISISFGKRLLVTNNNINIEKINQEDIVEVVDYNPIKKIVLVIGQKDPNIQTPVHWLIHHARNDIHAIVQVNDKELIKKFTNNYPTTEIEFPSGSLDLAKEILKKLKISKNIIIKNSGCLYTGMNLKEIEKVIFNGDDC